MRVPRHLSAAGWHRAIRTVALLFLTGFFSASGLPSGAVAQIAQSTHDSYEAHIAEASQRFRIPERWIRAVMQVESAGRVRAVSNAGAMGLMQIMPETWAELRIGHRLGDDPFDPRDNILGGTAYLREMFDRFGSAGFLAAYNAGPERYQQHLDTGRALPRETRIYVATLLPLLGLDAQTDLTAARPRPPDWRESPLFLEHSERNSAADPVQIERLWYFGSPPPSAAGGLHETAPRDRLFVPQNRDEETP